MENKEYLDTLVDRYIATYMEKPNFTEKGMDSLAIAIESEQAEEVFGNYCIAYEMAINMIEEYENEDALLQAYVKKIVP